ncbi:MAG: LuxR C-terminal-related transcriptional regulator [Bacteroidota bacterium]
MSEEKGQDFEHFKMFDMQGIREEDLDYSIAEKHIEFLKSMSFLNDSAISIFDLYKKEHLYMSKRFESLLGWEVETGVNDVEFTSSMTHPEDMEKMNRQALFFFGMALAIPTDRRHEYKNYKYVTDYRVKHRDGHWVRVIEQQKMLEMDKRGNVWLAMGILDISPDHDIETPARTRLINIETGQVFRVPDEEKIKEAVLSHREIEVLKLISDGLISKQIADKLFISVNTVNTHRQRIIEKLCVQNTAGAVNAARNMGLI